MSDSPHETSHKMTQLEDYSDSIFKKAVVVLTRLPEYKISALQRPMPQQFNSEDESLNSSESDMLWEPQGDSSDSDFSVSKNKKKTEKPVKSAKPRAPAQKNDITKKVSGPAPVIVSAAFAYTENETTKVRPDLPDEEVKLDMTILARKRHMRWQRGKIVEIVTAEDGRLKYKVNFEEKGKSRVSGHHIAFDTSPKLEQLYVGARVVVKGQENTFQPGILSELPSRKNRLRFLVFLDDHVPVYVGLPSLHLVCRPLADVLEDIPDSPHKSFMYRYLKDWPYPHLTQYTEGQTVHVELDGVQQKCEVETVDSSLIQVVFQDNQQKEWIHRGSVRLEHMARFLELTEVQQQMDDAD